MAGLRAADLKVAEQLVIERYYRGAALQLAGSHLALPESAIQCLEAVREGTGEIDEDLAGRLLELGVLEWSNV